MTLPNKLTFLRLILTPVGITLLFLDSVPFNFLLSTIVFVIAILTDVADGYIARKYNLITQFGTFIDPLADKLLILLYFIFLQNIGIYPLWLLIVFMARELIIDSLRSFALSKNVYVGAIKSGKIKAVLQSLSIIGGLLYLSYGISMLKTFAYMSMLAAFLISMLGMFILFKKNIVLLIEKSKK